MGQYLAATTFSNALQLAPGDATRILRFSSAATGNVTLGLPVGVSQGWSTGTVSNENMTYVTTVYVPSGVALDGVTNGSQTILPLQRCSFFYDTDGWHTVWLDRTPLVLSKNITTAVSNIDFPVPQGYAKFEFWVNRFIPSAAGSLIAYVSGNNGSTLRTGSSGDYYLQELYEVTTTSTITGTNGNTAGIVLTAGQGAGVASLGGAGSYGTLDPTNFTAICTSYAQTGGNNYIVVINSLQNTGQSNAIINPVNFARLVSSGGGTFTGTVGIRAIP